MELFLFYLFSICVICCCFGIVCLQNPVISVLLLIFAFCNASGLLFLLEMEFFALLILVVYVGAIAVLFLFVVMILNLKSVGDQSLSFFFYCFGGFICLFNFALFWFRGNSSFDDLFLVSYTRFDSVFDFFGELESLGHLLYDHYFLLFLVAGLILLVSILGAIGLSLVVKSNILGLRHQFVFQQMSRSSQNAIFLVKRVKS